MKYFKIGLDSDLSKTSRRAIITKGDSSYIEYNEGYVESSWVELTEEELLAQFNGINPFKENRPVIPEPYQPTNAEIAQIISDLQADLIIAGVL